MSRPTESEREFIKQQDRKFTITGLLQYMQEDSKTKNEGRRQCLERRAEASA